MLTACQNTQNQLDSALRDIKEIMVRGTGFSPLWTQNLALLDPTQSTGCLINDCEFSIKTLSGGDTLLAYPIAPIQHTLPNGNTIIPKGKIFYADPYFFQSDQLIEWSKFTYVTTQPLEISIFSLPMALTSMRKALFNLGKFAFVHCGQNISYYDHTTGMISLTLRNKKAD